MFAGLDEAFASPLQLASREALANRSHELDVPTLPRRATTRRLEAAPVPVLLKGKSSTVLLGTTARAPASAVVHRVETAARVSTLRVAMLNFTKMRGLHDVLRISFGVVLGFCAAACFATLIKRHVGSSQQLDLADVEDDMRLEESYGGVVMRGASSSRSVFSGRQKADAAAMWEADAAKAKWLSAAEDDEETVGATAQAVPQSDDSKLTSLK